MYTNFPVAWTSCCSLFALGGFSLAVFGILEKNRLDPFYQEPVCEMPSPFALRLSKTSLPSPLAESMGMSPGVPPFGMYFEVNTTVACTNPNQAYSKLMREGSLTQMFIPNMTDLNLGGSGKPYTKVSEGKLASDVAIAAASTGAEIIHTSSVEIPLATFFEISAMSTMQGYAPMYVRTQTPIETCVNVFGLPFCEKSVKEDWCGFFGGNCLAKVAGTDFAEPALCSMTKSICGTEEEMKKELQPDAMGLQLVATMNCSAASGLPAGSQCNVMTGPGVHSGTMQAQVISPPSEMTADEKARHDAKIAEAETSIHNILIAVIAFGFILGTTLLATALVCCSYGRGRRQMKPATDDLAANPNRNVNVSV